MNHESRMLLKLQQILFYSIILFLPTQLGKHFWPTWSYVSGLRVDYLSPTLYFTDVLIIILLVVWIVSIFPTLQSRIKNYELRSKGKKTIIHYSLFIILFIIFLLIGIFLSKNPLAGLYGLLKLLEFGFFGWYVSAHLKSFADMQRIVLLFSYGVIFESLLAIAQYLQQGSIGGLLYFLGERTFTSQTPGIANAVLNGKLIMRPYATFSHPNVLAGYLVIAMTLIGMNHESRIKNQGKEFFLGVLLVGTIALFLTMSRIAIIIWLVIAFIFLFKNLKLKIFVLGAVITLIIFMITPFHFRFSDFRLTDESVVRRIELIKTAGAMVKEQPFIGVGLNNFLPTLPVFQQVTGQSLFSYMQPVHNIFFLVAAETGIVGICFFSWLLIKTYRRIMNHKSGIKQNFFLFHNSCFLLLASILVLGMFDHYFLTLQQGQLLFAFVIGLCWSMNKHSV